jgi:hypothetical protein
MVSFIYIGPIETNYIAVVVSITRVFVSIPVPISGDKVRWNMEAVEHILDESRVLELLLESFHY